MSIFMMHTKSAGNQQQPQRY